MIESFFLQDFFGLVGSLSVHHPYLRAVYPIFFQGQMSI